MIPRFSLFGEPAVWRDNIRADPNGRWVNWRSVEKYVNYCLGQGVSFEAPVVEPVAHTYTDDELRGTFDELDELDDPEDDMAIDVLDYMERQRGQDDNL